MNAFAISLTVKSGIAVLIMLLYFSPVLPDNVLRLSFQATGLSSWFYERGRRMSSNKTEKPTKNGWKTPLKRPVI